MTDLERILTDIENTANSRALKLELTNDEAKTLITYIKTLVLGLQATQGKTMISTELAGPAKDANAELEKLKPHLLRIGKHGPNLLDDQEQIIVQQIALFAGAIVHTQVLK